MIETLGGHRLSPAQTAQSGLLRRRSARTFETYFLAGFFAVSLALASLFPTSGDDWAWGSQIGIDRLNTHFRDYNGRYAGDLLVILMTHWTFIAPLIVAATLTLTLFLILDVSDNRTAVGYLSVVLLFLLMPLGTWRQSVVWTSGFANYATSGLCVLIYLRALKQEWTPAPRRAGAGRLLLVFCIGLVSALFMEHVTLYLAAAGVAGLVAVWWKFARISPTCIAWALSFVVGAALMFSNGAYRSAATNPENYQQIQTTVDAHRLGAMASKVIDVISMEAVIDNKALNLVLVVLVALLLGLRGSALRQRTRIAVLALISLFFTLVHVMPIAQEHLELRLRVRSLNGLGALLLLTLLVLTAFTLVKSVRTRVLLLIGCVSIIVLVTPLLVVNPINPRCFYPTYLVFLAMVSVLLKEVLEGADFPVITRLTVPIISVIIVAITASNFLIYSVVHRTAEQRIADARAQIADGATAIKMKRLPFYGYVHDAEPGPELWRIRFKDYYGIPQQVEITWVGNRP